MVFEVMAFETELLYQCLQLQQSARPLQDLSNKSYIARSGNQAEDCTVAQLKGELRSSSETAQAITVKTATNPTEKVQPDFG
jgi:hypothetical protein